jgi:pimeloyl-ACP methyl ester carboxylesterase
MPQLDTDTLSIAYTDDGPNTAPPVLLLHGWPDDPHTWDHLRAQLLAEGKRVIVPALRGCGGTVFRHADTPRSGQMSALVTDILDLASKLNLPQFSVVGHDWGGRIAYNLALVAPERVQRCVAMSFGWTGGNFNQPLGIDQARNFWYHWYLATERGAQALRDDRRGFTRFIWQTWSPGWQFDDATFERTAAAFDNPDWAEVVIHYYRHRWGLAPSDPAYQAMDDALTARSIIAVPTLVLHGDGDTCNPADTSAGKEAFFSGPYQRVVVPRSGHFPQREQPCIVADAVLGWLR